MPQTTHASGNNWQSTILSVTNSADGPIELWWIDGSGNQQFYKTIEPGTTYEQLTSNYHN